VLTQRRPVLYTWLSLCRLQWDPGWRDRQKRCRKHAYVVQRRDTLGHRSSRERPPVGDHTAGHSHWQSRSITVAAKLRRAAEEAMASRCEPAVSSPRGYGARPPPVRAAGSPARYGHALAARQGGQHRAQEPTMARKGPCGHAPSALQGASSRKALGTGLATGPRVARPQHAIGPASAPPQRSSKSRRSDCRPLGNSRRSRAASGL